MMTSEEVGKDPIKWLLRLREDQRTDKVLDLDAHLSIVLGLVFEAQNAPKKRLIGFGRGEE